ncbi:MAG TPA: HD domain-containing protein [Longimicrobium sp.]|nr:HD domain-containing protein [Longimicrobium sp.]
MTDVVDAAAVKSTFGRTVEERFTNRLILNVPTRGNGAAERIIERVNADDDLYALWLAANVNAVERLGMTDHGPVHVKIVMNIAVKVLRVLTEAGVQPGVVANYGMRVEDAEVVVILASLLHDVGMSIHRKDHEEFSLFVAQAKIRELLDGIYPRGQATILRSEILHAIIGHRAGGNPMTIEAGIVRVADALDMAKGRSRISMEVEGTMSIHSVSAAAIEAVHIEHGETKPVRIRVEMSNSAGIFQLDQLFREKLSGSGLEPYVEVEALIEGEEEKRLVQTAYRL